MCDIKQKNKNGMPYVGMVIALLVVQRLVSILGGVVADVFTYEAIDPFSLFGWISVHHIVQMAIALIIILLLGILLKHDFGFSMGERKFGMKAVGLFSAGFGVYTLVAFGIVVATGSAPGFDFPLDAQNIGGTLGFQLLLSGPSEEILFRALPITMLVFAGGSRTLKAGRLSVTVECLIAALLFGFAHVRIDFSPFSMSADLGQLLLSFALGLAYGYVFQKTRSVLYPMMMHSISNVLMVGIGYLIAAVL